jgi:Noc2p family
MAKAKGGGVTKRMKKFQQKGGLGGIQKAIDKKREVRSIKRRQADRETNRAERAKALKEQVPEPAAPRASLPGSITKAEYLECPWLYGPQDPDDFDQLDVVTAASAAAALPKAAKKSKSLTAEAVQALAQIGLTDPPTAAQFDALRALVRAFHGTVSPTCADVPAKAACTAGSPEAALLSTVCLTQLPEVFSALLAPATEQQQQQQNGESSSDGVAVATSSTTTATAAARLARLQAHARMPRSEHWQALHGSLRRLCLAALDAVACEAGLSSESASSSSSDSLRALFPLLIAFPGLAKEWLRRLLDVAVSTDSADVALRALRTCTQLALSQPVPFFQSTLKAAYMAYRAAADRLEQRLDDATDNSSSSSTQQQQLTPSSAVAAAPAVLQALRQGLSELYSHEPSASYLHAYVYLHLLAARVEAAEASDSHREAPLSEVRSWTFLQSVLLWAQLVAAGIAAPRLTAPAAGTDAAGSDSSGATLRALVQPLCQIIERAVKLCPGAASLPHRLALARAAQDLAAAAGVFVPTAWMAFGALDFDSLYSSSSSSSNNTADAAATAAVEQQQQAVLDLSAVARLTREQLKARSVRRSVLAAATALLQREAALYSQSPGYPEYAQAMASRLVAAAAHLEDSTATASSSAGSGSAGGLSGKMRSAAEGLLKKSSAVERVRAKGSAHPGGVAALDALKPLDGDSAAVRLAKAVPVSAAAVKSVNSSGSNAAAGSSKHKKRRQKKAAAAADQ